MATQKVIFFTAGMLATAPELALIAKLNAAAIPAYSVKVFNTLSSPNYGAGKDAADYVAGTIPTAYNGVTVINPDAIPTQTTTKKVIFFLAGPNATTPELTAIAKLNAVTIPAYQTTVMNGAANASYGDGRIAPSNYVAGTVPAAFSGVPVIDPNNLPGTAPTVPNAPTSIVATAGNGSVTVSFATPYDGGSAILDFRVTLSNGATATGSSSPITVTGQTNGVARTATVQARNALGYSAASAVSNSVTPSAAVTAPSAPTIGTATAGNASAIVSFTAPASDGGATITGYRVTASTGQTATGAASPISVTGLTNGTPVTFTVQAQNSQGYGTASAASNSVTPAATWNKVLVATQWNPIANIKETRGLTGYLSRFSGYVGSNPLKTIKLNFPAILLQSASVGAATNLGNDIPLQKCSLEYNGVVVPITFSTVRNKRVPDGTTNVWADNIDVQTAFGVASLAVNARIDIKVEALLDLTSHSMPAAAPRGTATDTGQQVIFYDPAVTTIVNGTDSPGIYTTSGTAPQTRTSGYSPFVFGIHTTQSDALIARGDSITADTGDSGGSNVTNSGWGWFQRLMGKFTKKMASLNFAVHGSTRLAGVSDTRITDYYQYATVATIFFAANDFGSTGLTTTVSNVRTGVLAMRDALKAAGIRSVAICKSIPRVNSTDVYVTETNQTPFSGWALETDNPIVYNASLNTTDFDAVIDFDDVRGTTSVYKFRAPPARLFDTTHPNGLGYDDMANNALPKMQPLILY